MVVDAKKTKKNYLNTNLFLLAVVAVVVSYAYFIEYKGAENKKNAEEVSKKIIPFTLDKVTEFSVQNPNSKYKLIKENSQWKIVEPILDAGGTQVTSFLTQFFNEKWEEVITEGENIDLKIYGLDQGTSALELKAPDQVFKITVGTVAGLGGRRYLRLNDEKRVLLGNFTWEAQLQKSVNDLRDKMLIPNEFLVSKISIFNPNGKFDFEKGDSKWILKQLGQKIANEKAVDEMYYQTKNIKAQSIVTDQKSPSNLNKLGLNHPEIEILAGSPDKKQISLKFSKSMKGVVHAISNERDCIFSLSADSMNVFRKRLKDFEKPEEPLKLDPATDQKLEQLINDQQQKAKNDN